MSTMVRKASPQTAAPLPTAVFRGSAERSRGGVEMYAENVSRDCCCASRVVKGVGSPLRNTLLRAAMSVAPGTDSEPGLVHGDDASARAPAPMRCDAGVSVKSVVGCDKFVGDKASWNFFRATRIASDVDGFIAVVVSFWPEVSGFGGEVLSAALGDAGGDNCVAIGGDQGLSTSSFILDGSCRAALDVAASVRRRGEM